MNDHVKEAVIDTRKTADILKQDQDREISPKQSTADHAHSQRSTNVLLQAIYQSAVDPNATWELRHQFLHHLREDRTPHHPKFIGLVLNHIRRALRIGQAQSALQKERQQLACAIDAISPPILIIQQDGYVLGKNSAAEQQLNQLKTCFLKDNYLHIKDEKKLSSLLLAADKQQYSNCQLSEPNGQQIQLYAYKNQVNQDIYSLLMLDQSLGIKQSIQLLADRICLTPKEIEIIVRVMQNEPQEMIATQLMITQNTLRQHFKNIFQKTGVHNQTGLTILVLQNLILEQTAHTENTNLIPHISGLAQSQVLDLPNGQTLCFAEFGDPNGKPVLYFHALNTSRLEQLYHADFFTRSGIRIIAPDRPGFGYSSFVEHDSYLDFVPNTKALLDYLKIDQVTVLSQSAGCPHAMAFSFCYPQLVEHLHCVSLVPPPNHILSSNSKSVLNSTLNQLLRLMPGIVRPAMELMMHGQSVESLLTEITRAKQKNLFHLSDDDIDFMITPDVLPYNIASMVESLRQGTKAWAAESVHVNRDWNFDPALIQAPITIWHGDKDLLIPKDMVEAFAQTLKHAELRMFENETHLMIFRAMDKIVMAIHSQTKSTQDSNKSDRQEI